MVLSCPSVKWTGSQIQSTRSPFHHSSPFQVLSPTIIPEFSFFFFQWFTSSPTLASVVCKKKGKAIFDPWVAVTSCHLFLFRLSCLYCQDLHYSLFSRPKLSFSSDTTADWWGRCVFRDAKWWQWACQLCACQTRPGRKANEKHQWGEKLWVSQEA